MIDEFIGYCIACNTQRVVPVTHTTVKIDYRVVHAGECPVCGRMIEKLMVPERC